MRTAKILAAMACLVAASAVAASEVALEKHGGALTVTATFNGRFTGRFLLDTGATYCVVSKDVGRKAKIKGRVGGETVRLITANGVIEASLGEARRIEIGRESARDVKVAVVSDDPVPGLDGILGLSFLGQFSYSVDLDSSVLRLER